MAEKQYVLTESKEAITGMRYLSHLKDFISRVYMSMSNMKSQSLVVQKLRLAFPKFWMQMNIPKPICS